MLQRIIKWLSWASLGVLMMGCGLFSMAAEKGQDEPQTAPPPAAEPLAAPEMPAQSASNELRFPRQGQRIAEADGMPMVYVEAGEFMMGSEEMELHEKPVHSVTLDGFWIDQYEVPVGLFQKFIDANGAVDAEGHAYFNEREWREFPLAADLPAVYVTWYGAQAYCQWAGRRLPTEAEWEKAARGTDGRTFPWGEGFDCTRANYRHCGNDVKPVGSHPKGASPYGAEDMAGNVWEWVADLYGPYSAEAAVNPTGPKRGEYRSIRGGCWADDSELSLRSAYRGSNEPEDKSDWLGFRCAASE